MRRAVVLAGLGGGLLGCAVGAIALSIEGWGYEWQDSLIGMTGFGVVLGVLGAAGFLLGTRK